MKNKLWKYLANFRKLGDGILKIGINIASLGVAGLTFGGDKPHPSVDLIAIVIGLVLMFVGISLKE